MSASRPSFLGMRRADWWLLAGLMLFGFFLRYFSPIYPDFFTNPAAWPPVHLSDPSWPYQKGHYDSSTRQTSPAHGEVFDEIYFGDFAHDDIVGTPYFDPEPPLAKHIIALGELATGAGRLIQQGRNPLSSSINQVADLGFIPFGYRIMSVIFGSLLVGAIYMLARALWPNRFFAGAAGFLTAIDGMMLVQSRIGMIDVFAVTFIVLSYLAFFVHLRARTRRGSLISLAVLGVLLGLAVASKWIALAAILTMFVVLLWRHWTSALFGGAIAALVGVVLGIFGVASGGMLAGLSLLGLIAAVTATVSELFPFGVGYAREGGRGGAWLRLGMGQPAPLQTDAPATDPFEGTNTVAPIPNGARLSPLAYGALLGVFLAVVPALIYVASFWRWVEMHPCPTQPCGWAGIVTLHHQIWDYHANLRATHPYGSPWYTWPLLLRPVAYYFESQGLGVDTSSLPVLGNPNHGQGLVSGIINLGNPAIWWPADLSLLLLILWAVRRRALAPAFILTAFLAAWLPWAPVTRVLFMYHMFGGLPFMILAFAFVLAKLHGISLRIGHPGRALTIYGSDLAFGLLALALLAFLYWYPVWTGLPISDPGYLNPFPGGKMWLQGPTGSGGGYSWTFGWI